MTALSIPLPYPLASADVPRAINRLSIAVASIRQRLTTRGSRERLEELLRRGLREGQLTLAIKAVEAADKGDELADAALRDVGAELQTRLMQGQSLASGHLQVVAYLQRAVRRAPQKRKPGRYGEYDHWVRNCGICILIQLACAEFGVPETRNRESRRADRAPSAISLVTAALARNALHLDETTIQKHIWYGLWGELMRRLAAEQPVETWFQSVSQ